MPRGRLGYTAPVFALLVGAAQAATCPAVLPVDGFREQLRELTALGMNPTALHEALPAALQALPCLSAPLSPSDAAHVHQLVSIDAAWASDERRATAAAAAALRLDPEGSAALGAGNEVFARLVAAPTMMAVAEDFGTSLAAQVYVDGVETASRTVGQSAVLQVFEREGRPIGGAWLDGGAPLPDWVAFPELQCTELAPVQALLPLVERAERAYADLDVPAFEAALEGVGRGLPCVTARLGPPQAAAIHRLEGLRLFTHGADEAAFRSLQEARALDPLFVPAPEVVPPETVLAGLWDQAGRAPSGTYLLEVVPAGLVLTVDGVPSSVRPAALPTIVQLSEPSGVVLWTRYVPPGTRLPDFSSLAVRAEELHRSTLSPARLRYLEEGERRAWVARRTGLFAASAAAFTVSGALYLENTAAHGEWLDLDTPQSRLSGLQQRVFWTATGSSAALVAGSGLLLTALVAR
jgi:hypothetical protein